MLVARIKVTNFLVDTLKLSEAEARGITFLGQLAQAAVLRTLEWDPADLAMCAATMGKFLDAYEPLMKPPEAAEREMPAHLVPDPELRKFMEANFPPHRSALFTDEQRAAFAHAREQTRRLAAGERPNEDSLLACHAFFLEAVAVKVKRP